ncbi:MAG: hypothetical protein R2939_09705 [Kofleriaceae bacterium]
MRLHLGWRMVACASLLAGCLAPEQIACDDGSVCAVGRVCAPGGGCVVQAQLDRCDGVADDVPCAVDGLGAGACRDGVCRIIRCGDGVIDPPEVCEDGNALDGDGCSRDCLSDETCGNGVRDAGEACDDGNLVDGDACQATCTLPRCGDGVRDAGEVCDDGNTDAGDGCDALCLSDETCGNGVVDLAAGEACDCGGPDFLGPIAATCAGLPNSDDPAATCRPDCLLTRCGDGVLTAPEQCEPGGDLGAGTCGDFGFYAGTLGCQATCLYDTSTCAGACGDGELQPDREQCEGAEQSSCLAVGEDAGLTTCQACTISIAGCTPLGWDRTEVLDATQIEPGPASTLWLLQTGLLYQYAVKFRTFTPIALPANFTATGKLLAVGDDVVVAGTLTAGAGAATASWQRFDGTTWRAVPPLADATELVAAGDVLYAVVPTGIRRQSGNTWLDPDVFAVGLRGPIASDGVDAFAASTSGHVYKVGSAAPISNAPSYPFVAMAAYDGTIVGRVDDTCDLRRADGVALSNGHAGLACGDLVSRPDGDAMAISELGPVIVDGDRVLLVGPEPLTDLATILVGGEWRTFGIALDLYELRPDRWERLATRGTTFVDVAEDRRNPQASPVVAVTQGLMDTTKFQLTPTQAAPIAVCSTTSAIYALSTSTLYRCTGSSPLTCSQLAPGGVGAGRAIACHPTVDLAYASFAGSIVRWGGGAFTTDPLPLTVTSSSFARDGTLLLAGTSKDDPLLGVLTAYDPAQDPKFKVLEMREDASLDAVLACDDDHYAVARRGVIAVCDLDAALAGMPACEDTSLVEQDRVLRLTGTTCDEMWAVTRDTAYQLSAGTWYPARLAIDGLGTAGLATTRGLLVTGTGELTRLVYAP